MGMRLTDPRWFLTEEMVFRKVLSTRRNTIRDLEVLSIRNILTTQEFFDLQLHLEKSAVEVLEEAYLQCLCGRKQRF